jgi:TetR/AcrR family transcriptional repressor of mexJK operon
MEDNSKNAAKINQITDAAQKLFGLHGFEKVSMNEIADELVISKAALYYYFPDKESLCIAVLEKEKSEFIASLSSLVDSMTDPEEILREYSVLRLSYFRRFLNLSRLRQVTYTTLRPVFRDALMKFREREKEIIKKIFKKGISSGIFRIEDTDMTATLFFDVLRGLSSTVVNAKNTMTMEQEEYDILLQETSLFTDIFIKGLKANLNDLK